MGCLQARCSDAFRADALDQRCLVADAGERNSASSACLLDCSSLPQTASCRSQAATHPLLSGRVASAAYGSSSSSLCAGSLFADSRVAEGGVFSHMTAAQACQIRNSGSSALSTAHQRQLDRLLTFNMPTPLQKHLQRMLTGTQVVTNHRPITPYITATGLCVVPAANGRHKDGVARLGSALSTTCSAAPAHKPDRHSAANTTATPRTASCEPHPVAIAPSCNPPGGASCGLTREAGRQAGTRSPLCFSKRRTRGSKRKCRSSWHSLSEVSNMVMEMAGVDDDWLRNDLLPFAHRVYG